MLLWAAGSGAELLVDALLSTGKVEVNAMDMSGSTPLRRAATQGHEGIFRMLLDRADIYINAKNHHGDETVLYIVVESGYKKLVKMQLGRPDIEVNTTDERGRTPLSRAAMTRHEGIFRMLLERREIDVNGKDYGGNTPLHRAVCARNEANLRLLLAHPKIDVNAEDNEGHTALWCAERNRRDGFNGHLSEWKTMINLLKAKGVMSY